MEEAWCHTGAWPEAGTKSPEAHGFHMYLEQSLRTPVIGWADRLGRSGKISIPEPSLEHPSSMLVPGGWGSPAHSLVPLQRVAWSLSFP